MNYSGVRNLFTVVGSYLCSRRKGSDHSRRCHGASSNSVMVVGALGFVGARIAAHLHGFQRVIAVESAELSDMDAMWWYRWEQLAHSGLVVQLVSLSNQTAALDLVHAHQPWTIIYVPLIPKGGEKNCSGKLSNNLKEFVNLLESVKTESPCTAVKLVNSFPNSKFAIHTAWAKTFAATLATYHYLYNIPMSVFDVSGVYGPWQSHEDQQTSQQCLYVSDVVKMITSSLETNSIICEITSLIFCDNTTSVSDNDFKLTSLEDGTAMTKAWIQSLETTIKHKHKDVVFTSYFTSIEDSQRKRRYAANRFLYMKDWLLSIRKLEIDAVVFHDGLSPDFQWRLQLFYPKLQFQYVPSLKGRSTNDARFYCYLNYLQTHSDINRVLLTDISDVKFQRNPFNLMTQLGEDNLFIGTDIDFYPNMESMIWLREKLTKCYGKNAITKGHLSPLMRLSTVYNAGVIGSTRQLMLGLLTHITRNLDMTPHEVNCNMAVVNAVVHKHYFERLFTGFPLTSRFQRRQSSPKGVFIIHK